MIVYRNFEGDIRRPPGAAQSDVTFKEATTVFAAEDLVISEDPTTGDLRAIGTSARGRKLVVRHQRGQRIRILGVALCDENGREIEVPVTVVALATSAAKSNEPDTTCTNNVDAGATETALSKLDVVEVPRATEKSPARREKPIPRAAVVGAKEPNAASAMEAIKRAAAVSAKEPNGASGVVETSATSTTNESTLQQNDEPVTADEKPDAVDAGEARTGQTNTNVVEPITTSSAKGTRTASTARESRDDAPAAGRTGMEPTAPRRRGRPRRAPSTSQLSLDDVLSKAAARELENVPTTVIEDDAAPTIAVDPDGVERAPEARHAGRKHAVAEPIVATAPGSISATAPAKNGEQTNGWTAETYDLYWSAYATARDEARREGKSTREAQRLGREAGERAANGEIAAPPERETPKRKTPAERETPKQMSPPKRRGSATSWREAARAVKIEG